MYEINIIYYDQHIMSHKHTQTDYKIDKLHSGKEVRLVFIIACAPPEARRGRPAKEGPVEEEWKRAEISAIRIDDVRESIIPVVVVRQQRREHGIIVVAVGGVVVVRLLLLLLLTCCCHCLAS